MAVAQELEEEIIPSGGIADFVMDDEDIARLEDEETRAVYGDAGVAEFRDVARRMASYGRGGDQFVAHLAPGEIVVPRPLIERSPELRESIFSHLREMGIEDPEQYVVGSSANSFNPETGLMEFGWFSKIVKKVKSAVSSVGKVLKKAAPIVLPIVLSATPLGPVFGAALGSGIGTLINGGDLKQAAMSALIAGGVGAVGSGLSSSLSGGKFVDGFTSGFTDPAGRFAQTASGLGKTLSSGEFFTEGSLFGPGGQYYKDVMGSATEAPAATEQVRAAALNVGPDVPPVGGTPLSGGTPQVGGAVIPSQPSGFFSDLVNAVENPSLTTAKTAMFGPEPMSLEAAYNSVIAANPGTSQTVALALARDKVAESAPSLLRKYGPTAALGLGAAAAGGFFDTPKQEESPLQLAQGPTGAELLAADKDKYQLSAAATTPTIPTGVMYGVPTTFGAVPVAPRGIPTYAPFRRPVMAAAEGGEVYPRRVGGIMPDEGVPGRDSVRAMLMPGEFVMTTDAVRGASPDGNMRGGIRNMYSMMRNLERRGRALS